MPTVPPFWLGLRHVRPGATAFGGRSVFERYGEFQSGGYQHSQSHDAAAAAGGRRSGAQQLREDSAADYLARRDAALARRAQREQQEAAEQRAQYELRKQQLALATKQAEQELKQAHSAHGGGAAGAAGAAGDAAVAATAAPAGQGLAGDGQRTHSPPAAGTAAGQQRPDVGAKLLQTMRVARRAETAVLHAEHAGATSAGEGGAAQHAQRGEGSSHSAEVQAQAPPPSSTKQPTPAGAAATTLQEPQARPPSSGPQASAAASHTKQPTPAAAAASQSLAAAAAAAAAPPGLAASAGKQFHTGGPASMMERLHLHFGADCSRTLANLGLRQGASCSYMLLPPQPPAAVAVPCPQCWRCAHAEPPAPSAATFHSTHQSCPCPLLY